MTDRLFRHLILCGNWKILLIPNPQQEKQRERDELASIAAKYSPSFFFIKLSIFYAEKLVFHPLIWHLSSPSPFFSSHVCFNILTSVFLSCHHYLFSLLWTLKLIAHHVPQRTIGTFQKLKVTVWLDEVYGMTCQLLPVYQHLLETCQLTKLTFGTSICFPALINVFFSFCFIV